MKIIAIGLFLISFLAGCASMASSMIKQIPIIESNGSKSYVLTRPMTLYESRKEFFLKVMDERANELCPSGYTLLNEEVYGINPHGGGTKELVWQIRCKTS